MGKLKTYHQNDVIFCQGDDSKSMFIVRKGRVGVILDRGSDHENFLAELLSGQFLGEMGMLDSLPRSATAIALEDGTELEEILEEEFQAEFEQNPDQVFVLMLQMAARLHRTTGSYIDVCRTVRETLDAENGNLPKSDDLQARISKYTSLAAGSPAATY